MAAALTTLGRRAAAAALLLGSACTWLEQRGADLHDCVLYRWHETALGVAAVAKLGPLEAAVGGWYADYGWGKDTWWQTPGHVLTNHGTGLPLTTLGPFVYGRPIAHLLATSADGNHPGAPDAFEDVRAWLGLGDVFDLDDGLPFALSPWQRFVDACGVEVGVVPVATGLHLGFNVVEFADFVLGLLFLDLAGDDARPRPPTLPYLPAAPPGSGAHRR
ncbi:MAG: hypothetical protein KF830_17170 [Planctomycetes bacterium]|nr:hypothetical protein [Planctomycetota bacterium]